MMNRSCSSRKNKNVIIFSEKRIVGYSKEKMFSVVADVEKYHNFIPYCICSNKVNTDESGADTSESAPISNKSGLTLFLNVKRRNEKRNRYNGHKTIISERLELLTLLITNTWNPKDS